MDTTDQVNGDIPALAAWRKFAAEYGYDLNDLDAKKAFGGGWVCGSAWGADVATTIAGDFIRGRTVPVIDFAGDLKQLAIDLNHLAAGRLPPGAARFEKVV